MLVLVTHSSIQYPLDEQPIREFQKLNCPNPLGLDRQIQARSPEIRRIWQSSGSIRDDYSSGKALLSQRTCQ